MTACRRVIRPGLCSVTLRGAVRRRGGAARGRVRARARSSGVATCTSRPATPRPRARARAASDAAGVAIASYGSYLFAAGPPDRGRVGRGARHRGRRSARRTCGSGPGSGSSPGAPSTRRSSPASRRSRPTPRRTRHHRRAGVPRRHPDRDGRRRARAARRGRRRRTSRPTGSRRTGVARPRRRPTPPRSTALGARLSHLHVYEWAGPEDRRPLADGHARWSAVLDAARALGGDRVAFLEFVADDDPDVPAPRRRAPCAAWLAATVTARGDVPPGIVAMVRGRRARAARGGRGGRVGRCPAGASARGRSRTC